MAAKSSPKSSPKGKGKAKAVPPSPAKLASPEPPQSNGDDVGEENDLLDLAEKITAKAHTLISGVTDELLARRAQEVVKASFDRGAFF
jgi:hypothetical protein